MAKKPIVDKEKCIGCGTCAALCPAVFKMGEDGKSNVINPEGAPEAEIQKTIDGCPAGAISWQE